MNAYFLITFTEWCWVWMDGIWSKCLGSAFNQRTIGQRFLIRPFFAISYHACVFSASITSGD
jgi:hypothetical protein